MSLKLDSTTVLIGENNTGKSTVLDALQICLSRSLNRRGGIFSEYDYHLPDKGSQPVDSEPIEITLHFVEKSDDEWPDGISQRLGEIIQINQDDRQTVILRVHSSYRDDTKDFVTDWDFLNVAGNELVNAKAPRNIINLQQLAPVFYLAALRDSAQEFRSRSQFWSPFVRSMKIEPDLRRQIEEDLAELNKRVLDANESFKVVEEQLSKTGKMVSLDDDAPVEIEAIPTKVFDILSRTQVMLTSVTGARLPIGRHGEGTQSLAVICLFDAFLQSKLKESYTEFTEPILALEEPEAHLHPSAIHSISALLQELGGQKIIATHSGDLVASVPLKSLRRLRRKNGTITVHSLEDGILLDDQMRKINHCVRSTRGDLLFARCWLLVEGESERIIFEGCGRILGRDLAHNSVGVVEYQQIGVGLDALTKFANQMGIEWLVVADADSAGTGYIDAARKQIGGRDETRHLHKLSHGDLEVFLCMEGFGSVYEKAISPQKKGRITAPNGTLKYWKQVTDAQAKNRPKPRSAVDVVDMMEVKGKDCIPAQLSKILHHALDLSKEAQDA